MSNLATLAGELTVEDFAILGGMAGIHQFCRIGIHSMVGGATKVRQDCPPFMITESVNGETKVIGPNIVGLQRHGVSAEVRSAMKEAYRLLYREGLNRGQALERIKFEMDQSPEIQSLIQFYADSQRGVH
jgi:UDP-N-acetylglucosamine acyltransferase